MEYEPRNEDVAEAVDTIETSTPKTPLWFDAEKFARLTDALIDSGIPFSEARMVAYDTFSGPHDERAGFARALGLSPGTLHASASHADDRLEGVHQAHHMTNETRSKVQLASFDTALWDDEGEDAEFELGDSEELVVVRLFEYISSEELDYHDNDLPRYAVTVERYEDTDVWGTNSYEGTSIHRYDDIETLLVDVLDANLFDKAYSYNPEVLRPELRDELGDKYHEAFDAAVARTDREWKNEV